MEIHLLIKFAVTLVAIMNPLGNVPIFISLTEDYSPEERKKEAMKTAAAIGCILLIVTWLGMWLLTLFGIDVASFRTAGGLIILLMGLSMLQSKTSEMHNLDQKQQFAKQRDSIAVIPMAIPLFAGPGAICTVIVYSHDIHGLSGSIELSVIGLIFSVMIGILLFFSDYIGKALGRAGKKIVTRIMGLILSAMAVDMIFQGMRTALPGLAG